MANYYSASIRWRDGEVCEGYIFKVGDIGEGDDDDNVFFTVESESEMESFKKEGVEDFVVLNYETIKM